MEWYIALFSIVGLFLVMVLFGIPVNYSLGLSFIPILAFFSNESPQYVFDLFGMIAFRKLGSVVMIAIPMFMLMGQVFATTGVGVRLYEGFRRWLSWLPGGLAVATIMTNTLFAAVCGASLISAGTTGPVSIPSMVKHGYSRRLAAGAECSGSALAMLIPPSIPGIFYCVITEQSIGRLFMAGIVPGVILAALFVIVTIIRVKLNPQIAPKGESSNTTERIKSLPWIGGPLGLIIVIMLALYSGFAGVNEMAALGVCGAVALGLFYRELNLKSLLQGAIRCCRISGFFAMIMVCAVFMGFGFSYFGISQEFSSWIGSLDVPREVILLILMITFLLMGMIMDASALILVSMPVIYPVLQTLNYDPIWFGVILILNLEIGAITPPVGVNLFALKAAVKEIDMSDAIFGSIPFILMIALVIVLLVIFPDLALWLPNTMIE